MILQMLILSKILQQCFLKKAPQKNYLLLLGGCFSTSSIMGLAHENDVGEAMREGNTYFSFKRCGFWKKRRHHRLLSSLKVPGVQPDYCLERWILFFLSKKKKKKNKTCISSVKYLPILLVALCRAQSQQKAPSPLDFMPSASASLEISFPLQQYCFKLFPLRFLF